MADRRPPMRITVPAALIAAAALGTAVAWPRLPEEVPVHWNVAGEADRFGTPAELLLLFAALPLAWGVLLAAPRFDPRRANVEKFRAAYDAVAVAVVATLALFYGVVLLAALGVAVPMDRVVGAIVGLLFLVIGNLLPKLRSNFVAGVRTPWTLSSEYVWERTHRATGYVMFAAGVVLLLAALLVGGVAVAVTVVAAALSVTAFAVVYSYVVWRREARG